MFNTTIESLASSIIGSFDYAQYRNMTYDEAEVFAIEWAGVTILIAIGFTLSVAYCHSCLSTQGNHIELHDDTCL